MGLAATLSLLLAQPASSLALLAWSGPTARDTAGQGPPLSAIACPAAGVCVAVDSAGAVVSFDPADPQPSLPVPVDASAPTGLTCASPAQCIVVDVTGGEVTFDPAHPGAAAGNTIDSGHVLTAVACVPGTTVCVAVDVTGSEITFDPASPGGAQAKTIDSAGVLVGVSCPDAQTCMAIDSSQKQVTFDPVTQTVSSSGTIDPGAGNASLTAITCTSSTQCLAFDNQGRQIVLNPQDSGTISSNTVDQDGNGILEAACASSAQCAAVDSAGNEVAFAAGQGHGTLTPFDPHKQLLGVACAAPSRCVAIDGAGHAYSFDPAAPAGAAPRLIDARPSYLTVTCITATQCTAADDFGDEITFDPGSGRVSASGQIDASGVSIYSISCPSATQCTAVDQAGQEVTFNPSSPGTPTPTQVVKNQSLLAVSCPAVTQCTAVDDDGYAATFNPQSPTAARYIGFNVPAGTALPAIACASTVQCTALDAVGDVLTFNPQFGGRPAPVKLLSQAGVAIACPAPRRCVAVDAGGTRATFDPLIPSTGTTAAVDPDQPVGLACPGATFCVLADNAGKAVEFDPDGTGATLTHPVGSAGQINSLACGSPVSCIAVDSLGLGYAGTGQLPAPPRSVSPPVIAGRAFSGQTLHGSSGVWTPTPTSLHVQWLRCGRRGGACVPVPGATGLAYVLTPADVGHAIRLGESASDAGGASRSVVSAATAAVVAAPASPALRASLSGLSAGRPRLVLDLTAATSGPAFQRLAISLPAGLALRRATAITLSAGGRALQPRAVHAAGRTLTVRLPRPLSTLRIIVAFPSLSARASLRRAARRPAALRLTLVVQLRAIPGAAPIPPATATLRVIP